MTKTGTGAPEPPKGHAYVVGASEYGGPGDSSTHGDTGSCGGHLTGKPAFAELYMGNALGNLPCGTKVRITFRESGETLPKSIVAEKLDIGAGGAPVSGHSRRVDLWWETAKAIGFKGTGLVRIERIDGKPIAGPSDTNVAHYGLGSTTTGTGILGTGVGPDVGVETSEKAKEAVEGATAWVGELGKILGFIGTSSGWARIGKVVLGAAIMLIALDELSKIGGGPTIPGPTQIAGKTGAGKIAGTARKIATAE